MDEDWGYPFDETEPPHDPTVDRRAKKLRWRQGWEGDGGDEGGGPSGDVAEMQRQFGGGPEGRLAVTTGGLERGECELKREQKVWKNMSKFVPTVESFFEGVTLRLQFDPLDDVEFWYIASVVSLLVSFKR